MIFFIIQVRLFGLIQQTYLCSFLDPVFSPSSVYSNFMADLQLETKNITIVLLFVTPSGQENSGFNEKYHPISKQRRQIRLTN